MSKLCTALHFGADAVYFAGKNFGLRAFADNFTDEELLTALKKVHDEHKKAYVTVNIFARNADFGALKDYLAFLSAIGTDALIISDPGIVGFVRKNFPETEEE